MTTTDPAHDRPMVRTAIVGLGMGRHHVPDFRRHAQCTVVAVCDSDETKVRDACDELDIPHGFTSIDELLTWGEFDLASLALPNDLHEPITIRFLQAGHHVMAEKPLAINAEQGRRIVQAGERSGRKLGIHYNQRMSPEHQFIRRAFDAGEFGTPYYVRTGWMRRKGIPVGAAGWFFHKDRAGGGPLIDIGVHMLDSALYCCGFPRVLSVTGQTHAHFAQRDVPGMGMDVEDFATAYLRCENGLSITLEVSWAGHHEHRQEAFLHLYGTEGGAHRRTFYDDDWNADTTLTVSRERDESPATVGSEAMPADTLTAAEDLVQAILEDREPICTARQGLAVMEVLDAIYESSKTGREVRLAGD